MARKATPRSEPQATAEISQPQTGRQARLANTEGPHLTMAGGIIELPWPPAKLSPNGSHGCYHARRHAANKYRGDCLLLIRSQGAPVPTADGPIMLNVRFCPPTRVQSDLDNLLARAKHGLDALAECMGVNDHRFEFTLRRGDPVKGGKVLVEVSQ